MTLVNMRALKRFWFNGMRDVNDQFDAHSRHARSLSAVGRGLYPGPSSFTFTDVTGAAPETVYVSNTITIAGLTVPTPLSIDGGFYSKNGGPYRSTPSTVVTGDTITVQLTSSADPETAVNAAVVIGGVGDTYTVTTAAEGGGVPEWDWELDFENGVYQNLGSNVALSSLISDPSKVTGGALALVSNVDAPIELLGGLATYALTNNWTVVVGYEIDAGSGWFGGSYLFATVDNTDSVEFGLPAGRYVSEYNSGTFSRSATFAGAGAVAPGLYKTAVTRTPSLLAATMNGADPAGSDTTTLPGGETFITTKALIGGYQTGAGHANGLKIYSLRFKAPVAAAALPALSSP